jgi:zinc protease
MISLVLIAALATPAAPISVPYTKQKLKNGLTVILHEDHAVPRVYMSVRFNVGSARETPGRTGFAHLFEHLMFEGSAHVPEGKFDQWLEAAGGENNAYTSEDETYYYEEVPSNSAELPLFLDSDRMGFFADKLVDNVVDKQRDVVKNERRQSYENRPWGRADLLLPEALWPKGHPYSWPVIGSMADLSAASIDDVRNFYTKWYAPENAVLVVVGDFKSKEMMKLIEKWYGDVPARGGDAKTYAMPAPKLHTMTGEKRIVVEDEIAPLPKLTLVWPTVQLFHPDDAALDLLSSVLTQGAGSRLQKRLVHELQIAQEVSAYQQSMQQAGELHIEIIAQPGVNLRQILIVVDEELARLKDTGLKDEELARAKNHIETQTADALDSLGGKAGKLSAYETYLGEPDAFERDLARYRAATPASIVDVAKRRLGKGRIVLSTVPKGKVDLAIINPVTRNAPVGGAQ